MKRTGMQIEPAPKKVPNSGDQERRRTSLARQNTRIPVSSMRLNHWIACESCEMALAPQLKQICDGVWRRVDSLS
jgi:hypothetical protein